MKWIKLLKINKINVKKEIKIAIIGGSGFYELLKNPKEIEVKTPFGAPSDKIMIGKHEGVNVAFLPRHGRAHHLPPHKIPYKANMWALKEIGVKYVLAPCACGSLQEDVKPGEFVLVDQFVDRTYGRDDTYFHGPDVAHISSADPYCNSLRLETAKACKKLSHKANQLSADKIKYHLGGTVVVINGPRFSTRSESRWFSAQGWEVINMTNYPECVLARELEMCYTAICLVTDYDAGLEGNKKIKPVTMDEVGKIFAKNNEKVKKLVKYLIAHLDLNKKCVCHDAISKSRI